MARFVRGDVVVVPFPFATDQDSGKKRPALVLAVIPVDNPGYVPALLLILCEITSHPPRNNDDMPLQAGTDFQRGKIAHDSTIRPTRIWTIHERVVQGVPGRITDAKMAEVVAVLNNILTR